MTRSNRMLNRVILLVLGLIALGAAGALALPLLTESVVSFRLPAIRPTATLDGIIAAAAVVVIVLSVAWIVTRGRGRTRVALDGELSVDARVADELIREELSHEPDVISASAGAFRVRGAAVLRVRVEARRSADLRRLTDAVRSAVDQLDLALGTPPDARLPVVVHVSSGFRASLSREHRVA